MALKDLTAVSVLVVEDDDALREAIVETLRLANCSVAEVGSAEEACIHLEKQAADIIFSDVCMAEMDGHELLAWVQRHKPQIPFVLMTAYGTIERSVEAMRNGAVDYLVKPFEPGALLELLEQYTRGRSIISGPIMADQKTKDLYEVARRVAQAETTVLISGDSGSGKEVLSQFIHAQSGRRDGPFVAINCAAIPETMLEATLFGHEKGAFTGAYNSAPGKFEQANGGTLLLDEVSEMELGLQAKLLRVLQEREVERVGGRKTINLDVRVIATTNRNLRRHVEENKFREDLFYRLSVFPLNMPSLAERKGDIVALAEYLLEKHASRMHQKAVRFNDQAKEKLLSYSWPGNVRELDNVVQRALIMCMGDMIHSTDLFFDQELHPRNENQPVTFRPTDAAFKNSSTDMVSTDMASTDTASTDTVSTDVGELNSGLKRHELEKILEALDKTKGSKKDAADLLGLSPRTLRYKMAKFREEGLLED